MNRDIEALPCCRRLSMWLSGPPNVLTVDPTIQNIDCAIVRNESKDLSDMAHQLDRYSDIHLYLTSLWQSLS